jgi:hypothetical protein
MATLDYPSPSFAKQNSKEITSFNDDDEKVLVAQLGIGFTETILQATLHGNKTITKNPM